MSLPKLYLETTIPSYLTARRSRDLQRASDQQATEDWWNLHRQHYECFVSAAVLDEVQRGDPTFAAARLAALRGIRILPETVGIVELARRLLSERIIPTVAAEDAAHIAYAAGHGIEFLLTWNCTHINNPHLLRRIERACEADGFHCPVICTPAELVLP